MNDPEMREVLIALCDLVKIEFQYFSSLQTGMVRIYEVHKRRESGFRGTVYSTNEIGSILQRVSRST